MSADTLTGGLLSADYLSSTARPPAGCAPSRVRQYRIARLAARHLLGPAAAPRAIGSQVVRPLLQWLGWSAVEHDAGHGPTTLLTCVAPGAGPLRVLVAPLDAPLATVTRAAVRAALTEGRRWVIVTNGAVLRVVDVLRADDRGIAAFDLDGCADNPCALAWLAHLAGPAAFRGDGRQCSIERLVAASDAHGVAVCRQLRGGVADALEQLTGAVHAAAAGRRRPSLPGSYGEALTAVYRILFLLFAEARQLVPLWHPVYRDGYTLDALRVRLAAGLPVRGTWAALQAMARLAHAGCEAGDLKVAAFNGRLFSPARAPLLDHLRLDDERVGRALASLVFSQAAGGTALRRIAYAELGVEELGSVYESLLDLEPAPDAPRSEKPRSAAIRLHSTSTARKTTGTFYTPRALADFIVSSTLKPLVARRSADEILALRVLDPAMGSGAFLVAAMRYLAVQWEQALVASGDADPSDIGPEDRTRVRRLIASRCLFGVDRNPMAVQLAQLSLWLATLAGDRPLSFLDHHLVTGDSLMGASPLDLYNRVPGRPRRRGPLPLESLFDWSGAIAAVRPQRLRIESSADDTASAVREKEAALALADRDAAVGRWKAACDLWCACWMPGRVDTRLYHALLDRVLGRTAPASTPHLERPLEELQQRAAQLACVHWPLAFPEVLLDGDGRPAADRGFDAVVGNPPWEMLRADSRRDQGASGAAGGLVRFARDSGVYTAQGRGHVNQYQLFVERALMLARPGGRIGLLVPSGLLGDEGSAPLRRALLARANVDAITVFDNRRALFPIHRSVRFVTVTATRGERTSAIRCRFGVDDPASLAGNDDGGVVLTPAALERLSGPGMDIPDLPCREDLRIVESLTTRHPALGDPAGWGAVFGRELNATDDRDCFTTSPARDDLVVIEGKHLSPYRVDVAGAGLRADRRKAAARLGQRARFDRPRLSYRDVASATNRLTLIAAIVPPGAVTVHTVFCLQSAFSWAQQRVLSVLMNSFVANYLVRRRVTTHVSLGVLSRMPVPMVRSDEPLFAVMASAAEALERDGGADVERMAQAAAAEAYGVSAADLAHVLSTFPLVPVADRAATLETFIARTRPRSC